jgi:hypothetical protein
MGNKSSAIVTFRVPVPLGLRNRSDGYQKVSQASPQLRPAGKVALDRGDELFSRRAEETAAFLQQVERTIAPSAALPWKQPILLGN